MGLTPSTVKALTRRGHQVLVQSGAGDGSFISDGEYQLAGAMIVPHADDAWAAQMVVKVKEPAAIEYRYLRRDMILFTYLHLASDRPLTDALLESGATAIAYETVQTEDGKLPLLTPMSEVAGRMATQIGATYLQKTRGGRGVLMGGVPGVAPANVAILGAGIVGTNAARVAVGCGAQVTVLDINHDRLKYLDDIYRGQLQTRISDEYNIEEVVYSANLVIGAVLIPGGRAPWLITAGMLPNMRKGSVIVDVAVDQGGCVGTTRPTFTATPLMSSMASYIIVFPICPARFREPAHSRSIYRPLFIRFVWPRKDWMLYAGIGRYNMALTPHHGSVTYLAVAREFRMRYI